MTDDISSYVVRVSISGSKIGIMIKPPLVHGAECMEVWDWHIGALSAVRLGDIDAAEAFIDESMLSRSNSVNPEVCMTSCSLIKIGWAYSYPKGDLRSMTSPLPKNTVHSNCDPSPPLSLSSACLS